MEFKRKPARNIEAEQYLRDRPLPPGVRIDEDEKAYVRTIQGNWALIVFGDWVVLEVDGVHYYPIKERVFLEIYEMA